MPSIVPSISPTGGVIVLEITPSIGVDISTGMLTVQRYAGSLINAATTIYSGVFAPVIIDDGEQLPNYLDAATTYFYTAFDTGGVTTTPGIQPVAKLAVTQTYLDKLLFRMFSSGVNSLNLPTGISQIRVLQAMPLTLSSELMPFAVMNLDLEQQEQIQIGEGFASQTLVGPDGTGTIPSIVLRRYSLNVLTLNAKERDFYKDACIGVVYSMLPVLQSIGNDVHFEYQAAQSQVANSATMPGFYLVTVMIDIQGIYNVQVDFQGTRLGDGGLPFITSVAGTVTAYTSAATGIITYNYAARDFTLKGPDPVTDED